MPDSHFNIYFCLYREKILGLESQLQELTFLEPESRSQVKVEM